VTELDKLRAFPRNPRAEAIRPAPLLCGEPAMRWLTGRPRQWPPIRDAASARRQALRSSLLLAGALHGGQFADRRADDARVGSRRSSAGVRRRPRRASRTSAKISISEPSATHVIARFEHARPEAE
jgi:hypothetical protein